MGSVQTPLGFFWSAAWPRLERREGQDQGEADKGREREPKHVHREFLQQRLGSQRSPVPTGTDEAWKVKGQESLGWDSTLILRCSGSFVKHQGDYRCIHRQTSAILCADGQELV